MDLLVHSPEEIFEQEVSKKEEDWNLPLMFQAYEMEKEVLWDFDYCLESTNRFMHYLCSQIDENIFREIERLWDEIYFHIGHIGCDVAYSARSKMIKEKGLDDFTYNYWEAYYR